MDRTSDPAELSLALNSGFHSRGNTLKPMNTGSNTSPFPPEILFSVFSLAVPPYAFLETPLCAGRNSTWNQALRLMKSIVLVCRSWYDVGIIFLYENICIRRGQELNSLRRTLTRPAKNLGLLVKSLTIQCYIPNDNSSFGEKLKRVIACCTLLSTFSFNTPFVPPPQAISITFPTHITHFRLEGHFEYATTLQILNHLKETLLSLHLMVWDKNFAQAPSRNSLLSLWSSKAGYISQSLHFSSLQSLTIGAARGWDFGILAHRWAMPSLQRLTVAVYGVFVHDELSISVVQSAIESFLSDRGHQIRHLHIALQWSSLEQEDFKKVLELCPQLERLTIAPDIFLRKHWTDSEEFFHPHLRCIDLLYNPSTNDEFRPSELCLSKKNLPSLGCVRRFCNIVNLNQGDTWIDNYPPNPEAEKENFVINVFQHRMEFRDGSYIWIPEAIPEADLVSDEEADRDSDSDYVPTTSDEDEDSSEEDEFTSDSDSGLSDLLNLTT